MVCIKGFLYIELGRRFFINNNNTIGIFGKNTYDVSPYDSQRSHSSMDLGVKWDLCVLFVQTAVKCQDCKFV